MLSPKRKTLLVAAMAAIIVLAGVSMAFAAPLIPVGYGWVDNPGHTSYPGFCLNCHSGFVAGFPPPAITAGVAPAHHDRGSTCTQCHVVKQPVTPPRVPVTYLKGGDRYATAISVSTTSFPGNPANAPCVVLATGSNYPDALCAAPLAKAYGGPILLVRPGNTLSADVLAEVNRLHPAKVFIVGGTSVVPAGIASQVAALPWAPSVTRLAGLNRYETAGAVAAAVKAKLGSTPKVVVASGLGYADALSVAPLAAAKGWPILLTLPNALPSATTSAVASSGATSCLIVGGPTVVATSLESRLPAVTRKGGLDRYDTCAQVAAYAKSLGMGYTPMVATVGTNYPDALAAGPFVAKRNGVLLLTRPTGVPTQIATIMSTNKMAAKSLVIVGGAVPAACVNVMNTLLK